MVGLQCVFMPMLAPHSDMQWYKHGQPDKRSLRTFLERDHFHPIYYIITKKFLFPTTSNIRVCRMAPSETLKAGDYLLVLYSFLHIPLKT